MKKYTVVFLMIALFMMVSCRKESKGVNSEASITGIWKAQKIEIDGSITTPQIPLPIPFSQVRDSACNQESTMTLNVDESGVLILKDDLSGMCSEIMNQTFSYSFDSSNQTLDITENGISESAVVEALTDDSLVLKRTLENYTIEGNSFSGDIIVYFVK